MNNKVSNPCSRCGTERIASKTWSEQVKTFIGTSLVTYTENICPNPECQKIVNQKLKVERDKKKLFDLEREKRAEANKIKKANLHLSKKSKTALIIK